MREQAARGNLDKKAISSNNPQLKRDPPNIFKSFAKSSPKLKLEDTDNSAACSDVDSAAPSRQEDGLNKSVSEDEDDYIAPPLPFGGLADTNRKSRREREAALKKMMEDDDFEEAEDVTETAEHELSMPENTLDQLTEEVVQVTGNRRRGRRKVMKKRTIKDEEDYLGAFLKLSSARDPSLIVIVVTKEEQVWESFSEDELAVPKPKAPSSFSSSGDKSKKKPGKPGQGSIMSFFGKK
jgi:DNA polymerase delta subunit 3